MKMAHGECPWAKHAASDDGQEQDQRNGVGSNTNSGSGSNNSNGNDQNFIGKTRNK